MNDPMPPDSHHIHVYKVDGEFEVDLFDHSLSNDAALTEALRSAQVAGEEDGWGPADCEMIAILPSTMGNPRWMKTGPPRWRGCPKCGGALVVEAVEVGSLDITSQGMRLSGCITRARCADGCGYRLEPMDG